MGNNQNKKNITIISDVNSRDEGRVMVEVEAVGSDIIARTTLSVKNDKKKKDLIEYGKGQTL